jgi:hypothetical protein
MRCRGFVFSCLGVAAALRGADPSRVDPAELAWPPSALRIEALTSDAAQRGWGASVPGLRAAALTAYQSNIGQAATWYHLYRWAALLARPERKAVSEWMGAVNAARVGHANMSPRYTPGPGSLAARWSRELQLHALGSPAFSEEFYTTLQPVDDPVAVLSVLQQLFAADSVRFVEYQNLALAIAVVYDVPPPPAWPHGQVSAAALPRVLPAPLEAFDFWVKADRGGRTLHRLKRLPAAELKFVVDVVAPFRELVWAQQSVHGSLAEFARVYDSVRYRRERVQANQANWPRPRYELALILKEGGICVDQAYFASTVGKAKGVPTLLFRGAGLDGRHAWFGYIDGAQKWRLDCGRPAGQNYVAGFAFDPQSWADISDHELAFISERFRALPTFKLASTHADFAGEFLRDGHPAAAVKAAREAVNREPRHLRGWEVLLAAQAAAGADARTVEGTLSEAARAFQRYPDLEASFARRFAQSLRARGETSLADAEEKRLAAKNRGTAGRPDLAFQQAAERLARSVQSDDLPTQIRTYNSLVDTYGRGAGIDFFDKVVEPFARHLEQSGQVPAALQAVQRAERTLRIEKGGQLEAELHRLMASLKPRR